jgi:hypothetical protein
MGEHAVPEIRAELNRRNRRAGPAVVVDARTGELIMPESADLFWSEKGKS